MVQNKYNKGLEKIKEWDEDSRQNVSFLGVKAYKRFNDFLFHRKEKTRAIWIGKIRNIELHEYDWADFTEEQIRAIRMADKYAGGAFIAYPSIAAYNMMILGDYMRIFSSPFYYSNGTLGYRPLDNRIQSVPRLYNNPGDYMIALWKIGMSGVANDEAGHIATAYLCHLLFYGIDVLSEVHLKSFPLDYWDAAAMATAFYELADPRNMHCTEKIYNYIIPQDYRTLPPKDKCTKSYHITDMTDFLLRILRDCSVPSPGPGTDPQKAHPVREFINRDGAMAGYSFRI